ncbi:Malignant T-cell-amplified sequence 1 [Lunasporangiospora selenospora]|uniref:Translation machinery-associated protein 20 n=1 Tax=Lunasporangiospora selenospora TaxID=979761 RepID=A0A9P6KHH6_9FUNG|nr:Malignant T-cell-amplified sequence 1 [Lunasporangiospora selenospora]
MFKKFSIKDDVTGHTQVKSSVQRSIRAKILDQYKAGIEGIIDDVMPKKVPLFLMKCHDHISLIVMNNEILFYQRFEGPYFPTLRLLHKYPNMLPRLQVDRGAIKFVLAGANIMCPGLTSKGARMEVSVPAESMVAITAEGKNEILAVGLTKMSTEDIRCVNKGIGVETAHSLNDSLWKAVVDL